MRPAGNAQLRLFGQTIQFAVDQALELRSRLRSIPIRDIGDVEAMAVLDAQSRNELALTELIADALVGVVLTGERAVSITALATIADEAAGGGTDAQNRLRDQAMTDLMNATSDGSPLRPFHWPLEFPEVFVRNIGGFDAILGNPPFKRGKDLSGLLGQVYREYLVKHIASNRRGSADLVVYFFLRANQILRDHGCFGLLATNTIAEGDTRQVGLEPLLAAGNCIYQAHPNEPWPGAAAVMVSRVHVYKGKWTPRRTA